ncbi:condensation domain-containing protein [Gordonia tangerina]|uniref:Condensation domain-containing protein n=1 Tax=Gordonia tangerina TaxID=2911060 RepID=A0ABS9DQU7_9ACTN|nr:condensation domain-containing protein [Gordonia tangerina]MCF3940188.1 condensation domain-containing protein [Gordonia tangerina]
MEGPIDVDAFGYHTSVSVREGMYLQLWFEDTDEGPVGIYDPAFHYWPDVIDLRNEDDRRCTAEDMMREDYSRPVDPLVDRTARGCLFVLSDSKFLIYNRAHHMLTDGVGGKDRMVEALATYTAGVRGEPPSPPNSVDPRVDRTARGFLFLMSDGKFLVYIRAHHLLTDGMGGKDRMVKALAAYTAGVRVEPPPPPNPVDLDLPAREDAEYRASRRFEIDLAHWREAMAGVGIAKTLAHREGPPEAIGRQESAAIPDAAIAAACAAAEHNSTILPTVIAAAFGAYLSRVTDGDEVIFQFTVAAPTTKDPRSKPLPVANTVSLRTRVPSHSTVAMSLKTTQSALMRTLRHERFRGEDICADVVAPKTSGRTPRTSAQERAGRILNLMPFERTFPCGEATATFQTVGVAECLGWPRSGRLTSSNEEAPGYLRIVAINSRRCRSPFASRSKSR